MWLSSDRIVWTWLAVVTAVLVSAVALAGGTPWGRGPILLSSAELQNYLGGGCNNTQMTTVPCTNPNNDCRVTSLSSVYKKGTGKCYRWVPHPQAACTDMQGWDCECTSQPEGCAEQFEGSAANEGCPEGCKKRVGTCGIVKTECTSRKCDDGDG